MIQGQGKLGMLNQMTTSQKVTAAPLNNHKVWVKRNEPTNQTAPEFLKPTHQSATVHVIIRLSPQNSKTKQTPKQCMIIWALKTATDYQPRPPLSTSAPNCSPLPVLVCWSSVKLWMVYITHLHLPTTIMTCRTRFNSEGKLGWWKIPVLALHSKRSLTHFLLQNASS